MQKIYLALIATISIAIILFVATFFYIDTHRHTTFFYCIKKDTLPVAAVELDKYNTEESIVYKSVTSTPFRSTSTIHKRKLSIDKKGLTVHSYNKKHLSKGIAMDAYIRKVDSSINFLAMGHSNFAYAKRLPVDKHFIIFESDAIVSYFNLIDKYDFKKGGLQTIPILTHTYTFLPPYKSYIDVKLHKEEVLKLGHKKIKAVRLTARLAEKKEITLWISRWTHIPLKIKIPASGFSAIKVDEPIEISAQKYIPEDKTYEEKEILFESKDSTLSGTLSIPEGDGPFPGVLLVWGPGPFDREYAGIFTDIALSFAKRGIATLRFDKRGIGKSEGDFSKFTGHDMIDDVSNALNFLKESDKIDIKRIAILGHSEGGYYASQAATSDPDISACIIMGGIETINLPDTDLEMMWNFDKSALKWDEKYLKDIARCAEDTSQILNIGKDWAFLLQKRVYLKKTKLDRERKPVEIIRNFKIPLLILRGKKDTVIPQKHIKLLKEILKESGNKEYRIVSFNRLNHFFGKKVEDNIHRTHISVDKQVTDTIINWLEKNLLARSEPKKELKPLSSIIEETPAKKEGL